MIFQKSIYYVAVFTTNSIQFCITFTENLKYYIFFFQVFCNCGEAENNFYHRFSAAEEACSKEPHEGGYGSCLAVEMGFVSF